jgi:lipoprotein NlpD
VNTAEAEEVVYCGQGLIGFGQLLIIKHNKVYLSSFANNRLLMAKQGQQVKKARLLLRLGK